MTLCAEISMEVKVPNADLLILGNATQGRLGLYELAEVGGMNSESNYYWSNLLTDSSQVTITRGRSDTNPTAMVETGVAVVNVLGSSWDPAQTTILVPGIDVRIMQGTNVLWQGKVGDTQTNYDDYRQAYTTVTCYDSTRELFNAVLDADLEDIESVSDRLAAVMGSGYAVTGTPTASLAPKQAATVGEILSLVQASELGFTYVDKDGTVQVRARTHTKPTPSISFSDIHNQIPATSLVAWYDARSINGLGVALPSDGAAISVWKDISGNGRHLTQANSNKYPTFKTNVMNGNPAARFDGSNDLLAMTIGSTISQPFTVYLLTQTTMPQNQADAQPLSFTGSSVKVKNGYWAYWAGSDKTSTTAPTGGVEVITTIFNGVGSEQRSNGTVTTSGTGGTGTMSTINIGCAPSGFNPYKGDIAAVVIYSGAHDEETRRRIEGELRSTYGGTDPYHQCYVDIGLAYDTEDIWNAVDLQNYAGLNGYGQDVVDQYKAPGEAVSVATYGEHLLSASVNLDTDTNDNQITAWRQEIIDRYASPTRRVRAITYHPWDNASLKNAGVDVGDTVFIDFHDEFGTEISSGTYTVYGVNHQIDPTSWQTTLTVGP